MTLYRRLSDIIRRGKRHLRSLTRGRSEEDPQTSTTPPNLTPRSSSFSAVMDPLVVTTSPPMTLGSSLGRARHPGDGASPGQHLMYFNSCWTVFTCDFDFGWRRVMIRGHSCLATKPPSLEEYKALDVPLLK